MKFYILLIFIIYVNSNETTEKNNSVTCQTNSNSTINNTNTPKYEFSEDKSNKENKSKELPSHNYNSSEINLHGDNPHNKNYSEKEEVIPLDIDIVSAGIITDQRTNISPRIVGGNPADPGMFTYQVAVLIYLDKSKRYYFCGGVLIDPCFVLTAAHCCESALSFQIILGATNFRVMEPSQIRLNATIKIIHPGWNRTTMENDLCIIKLPVCVNATDCIKPIPICNKTKKEVIGLQSIVSGWGRSSDNSFTVSNELRYVSVPIITTKGLCRATYSLVCKGNICTSSDYGMSPCNGDSGGPMIIMNDDGTECVIGVISFGHVIGCQRGYPAVQTFIPCYAKWILKVKLSFESDYCDCNDDDL